MFDNINPAPVAIVGGAQQLADVLVYLKLQWAWHLGFFTDYAHILSRKKMVCFGIRRELQEPPAIFFNFLIYLIYGDF